MNLDLKADRAEFIALLRSTGREGVDDLIEYLDDGRNRFFTAPANSSLCMFYKNSLEISTCHPTFFPL